MPRSSTGQMRPQLSQVQFAGLRFTPLTVAQTVDRLADRAPDAPFAAFVTPNAEHAYLRRRNAEFDAFSKSCWISTNDSRVIGRAARLAGLKLEFAPGAYVVRALFEGVISQDTPICILGGTTELVDRLVKQYGLNRVAHHIPPMGFIDRPQAVKDAINFVAENPARFIFVAMGPPQSELFCHRIAVDGRATGVGLCIGSSLSVLTGALRAAPYLIEHSGFVWLYRLIKEPKRLWRRYLVRAFFGVGQAAKDVMAIRLGLARPTPDA